MDKRIGWYVVELERKLRRGISPERAQQISAEIQSHIEEDVQSQIAQGTSAVDAVRIALHRVGRPEWVARRYLEVGTGLRLSGMWEWTSVLSAFLTGALGICFVPFSMGPGDADVWLISGIGVFALLFCVATLGVRRHMLQHLLFLFVFVLVVSTIVLPRTVIGPVYEGTGFVLRTDAQAMSDRLTRELRENRNYLGLSRAAYSAALKGEPLAQIEGIKTQQGFLAPNRIWDAYSTYPNWAFTHVKSEEEARLAWFNVGRRTMAVVKAAARTDEIKLAAIDRWLTASPSVAYFDSLRWTAAPSALWLLALSVAHLLFLGIGRGFSAIRQSRLEVAQTSYL